MRNQPSMALANDKRMEVLLRKEMMEHQAIISSHHKEMATLRESLIVAMQKFDALFEYADKQTTFKTDYLNEQVICLQEQLSAQKSIINEQKNTIRSLYKDVHDIYLNYIPKSDLDKFKKEIKDQLNNSEKDHLICIQNMQRELKGLFSQLLSDFVFLQKTTEEKVSELKDGFHDKLAISRMEKDSVLKELRSYQQSMFVIEKKIENIYTLIERINKRG